MQTNMENVLNLLSQRNVCAPVHVRVYEEERLMQGKIGRKKSGQRRARTRGGKTGRMGLEKGREKESGGEKEEEVRGDEKGREGEEETWSERGCG